MITQSPTASASDVDSFIPRHIGPSDADVRAMLELLGYDSLDAMIDATVPSGIRMRRPLQIHGAMSESEALANMRAIATKNRIFRSYIGLGYHDCVTPPVVQRNVLENPGWYTAYTPYQAEIAQGRLEALLTFQTMVIDLTGLGIANASLLDEGTAAAEAMALCFAASGGSAGRDEKEVFFIASDCHPQTIAVVQTRAHARGLRTVVGDHRTFNFGDDVFGALVQYPATDGAVYDYREFCERAHAAGALVTAAADLMSLALLAPPGEWGADVCVGNTQRFGVPMGYGGPHAAFFATRDEFKRLMPGRIIGVSRDADGKPALRMALQTREQHIRREKATSNVCTAQVLLAVIAAMYAVWHGPKGITGIARRIHKHAVALAAGLESLGHTIVHDVYFDTLRVQLSGTAAADVVRRASERQINLRVLDDRTVCVALDETVRANDVADLLYVFAPRTATPAAVAADVDDRYDERFARTSAFLTHPIFNSYQSETEMLRYLKRLENRDLSLTTSMIPLGSCTMKLNAAAEMYPITWPELCKLHPFAPREQAQGYRELFERLETALAEITGFDAVSLQPNAGSQGEYAGLLVIRAYHESRGETHRNVCLIPHSAHGTNPASAVMAGMKVVVVRTDANGNIDLADLEANAEQHKAALAALMVTYPSTHGVFEAAITSICEIVHSHGGQVYLDGANMNAMVGLSRPGDIGADVCHLNLHKTFCIPHGGGGPGMGPICVAKHLAPFLPNNPVVHAGGEQSAGVVSAAPWGSADILPISMMYIDMMGGEGLTRATKIAILNANYMAKRLEPYYPVLYRGQNGMIAHECIIDPRGVKSAAGVDVEDIAKRLMDYGFHAPTVSFPVAGTLMIEPTESESKAELDRFTDALIAIREEIREIEIGLLDRTDNPLKNAPHPMTRVVSDGWDHKYGRERAAFPAPWTLVSKFWPSVGRVESAYGDRNLVCSCLPTDAYAEVVADS